MYQLNFPNGNIQIYGSWDDLDWTVRLFGGKAMLISGTIFAFVPANRLS